MGAASKQVGGLPLLSSSLHAPSYIGAQVSKPSTDIDAGVASARRCGGNARL